MPIWLRVERAQRRLNEIEITDAATAHLVAAMHELCAAVGASATPAPERDAIEDSRENEDEAPAAESVCGFELDDGTVAYYGTGSGS